MEALPYRSSTWLTSGVGGTTTRESPPSDTSINNAGSVKKMVSENAVIVFGQRGCCMCHVVNRLLLGLGVNPTVFEVDEKDETAVIDELSAIAGGDLDGLNDTRLQFPAVFVGGKLFGGLERVMATHISGELVPILKEARALWL